MTSKPYAVRKLDTDDPYWHVVDLRIPDAAILAEGSVLDVYLQSASAHRAAEFLNANDGALCLARYGGSYWPGRLCIEQAGHGKFHQDGYGRTW